MVSDDASSTTVLGEAWQIQREAAKRGFDWVHVSDVIAKVREELDEIEDALSRGNGEQAKRELGDLVFSAVNLARFLDARPWEELHKANVRFQQRFARLEDLVRESGRVMEQCSLDELDEVWEQVKAS